LFGSPDVTLLAGLVAAGEQDDERVALLLDVDALARPVRDPQLRDALTNRLGISGVSGDQAFNPGLNARPCVNVTQAVEPPRENLCLANLKHGDDCIRWATLGQYKGMRF